MQTEPRRGPHGTIRPPEAERFLAFALTAADLLLEVSGEGRIGFAAGAFEARLGQPADSFLGRPVETLLAVADRPAFATAFALLLSRGRLPPTAFRLADATGTPVVVAGLSRPDVTGPRLAITFGAMPASPASPGFGSGAGIQHAAEAALRGGRTTSLGLLELAGRDGPIDPRPELAERIGATIAESLPADALVGALGGGRYGLLSGASADFSAIAARIEGVVRQSGLDASVETTRLPLEGATLSPLQATRALRFALSAFARGGADAMREAGFRDGLAGFVAAACSRAAAVRAVIENRRFRLAFQPIAALRDRSHHHYEALLRPLATPSFPVAGAAEFVTFAETVGLSEELDWAVVETVCEAARRAGGARIACNLSGLSLQSPAFGARLVAVLAAEPALAARLLVEITETAEIEDEVAAQATIVALRGLGVPICIDDFGAGAAAFRYLRAFRSDFVKIDGSYIARITLSDQDRGFVAAMVDLARTVGAAVVAERVETEAEARILRALGVEYGQGWLFGRPGPLPGSL